MKLTQQNFVLEHDNLAHADYIYLNLILNLKNRIIKNIDKNQYGIILSQFKNNKGDKIELVINANKGFDLKEIDSFLLDKESAKDPEVVKEYFINGTANFLNFSDHAYIKVIKNNDPWAAPMVFTNYLEAVEYLDQIS